MALVDETDLYRNYHSIQVGDDLPPLDNPECTRVDGTSAAFMCANALTGKILVVKGATNTNMNFYEIMAWSEYFVHKNFDKAIVMPSGLNHLKVLTNPL